MNIYYKDLDLTLPLEENQVTTLIIDNKSIYRQFSRELVDQCDGQEGHWLIEDEASILNLKKSAYPILNNWYIDLNEKSILTKLNAAVAKLVDEEIGLLGEINQKIQYLYEKIDSQLSMDINHNDMINAQDLVKISNFSILQDYNDTISTFISYIELLRDYLDIKVFFLFNLRKIVSDEELSLIYKTLLAKKILLFCLETGEKNIIKACEQEKLYILDQDFCII